MTINRLLSILLSVTFLAVAAIFLNFEIARSFDSTDENAKVLLEAQARVLATKLEGFGRDLPILGKELSTRDKIGVDIRMMTNAMQWVKDGEEIPAKLQIRLTELDENLKNHVQEVRNAHLGGYSFALVNAEGRVLSSDISVIENNTWLIKQKPPVDDLEQAKTDDPNNTDDEDSEDVDQDDVDLDKEFESTKAEIAAQAVVDKPENEDEEDSEEPPQACSFVRCVIEKGESIQETKIFEGRLRAYSLDPIMADGKIVGVSIVEQVLAAMPVGTPENALILDEKSVVLGKVPAGLNLGGHHLARRPMPVQAVRAYSNVPFFGRAEFSPLFIDNHSVAIWAAGEKIKNSENVWVASFADLSPEYARLGGLQLLVFVIALSTLLIWLIDNLGTGRQLDREVDRIIGFLGRLRQGQGDKEKLDERDFKLSKAEMLVRLINHFLEKGGSGGGVSAIPESPSLDEVIAAQAVREPDEISSLDIRGLIGNDSSAFMPPAESATDKVAEGVFDDDGFESLPDFDVGAGIDPFSGGAHPEEELPALTDALSAIDHLSDSDSASAQETPVPVIKKPEPKVSAPVTKKPEREASTTVMKMSPELLAAMKKKGKAKKAVATTEAASGSATADLFGQAGFQKTTPPSEESPPQLSERDDVATRVGTAPEMATTVRRVPAEIMEKARGEKLQAEAKAKAALKNEAKELESFVDVEPEDDDPRGLFRPVFDDFVRTRSRCGETTEELTFDKFATKLEKSKAAVIAKHGCQDVKFLVYVKDGRAALKATPVK